MRTGSACKKTSFGADENVYVPLAHIASTVRIISKPTEFLALGLATLIIWGLGIIFLLIYLFSKKRIIIGVMSSAGTAEALKIKVDDKTLKDIRQGGKILERLLTERTLEPAPSPERRSRPAREEVVAREDPAPWASEGVTAQCPNCGTRISIPIGSVGKKIRCTHRAVNRSWRPRVDDPERLGAADSFRS
ncbi:MAG: hypothetical protein U0792_22140 [Gemmataceae bacterium]